MNLPNINVFRLQPVRSLLRWAQTVTLPGVNGASLYDIGRLFFIEITSLKLKERAAGVTYNFLMALPPTFLFLFSLLPYLPFKNVDKTIFNIIQMITPNRNIYISVRTVLGDIMTRQHNNALSFGIALVIFFSSNGVMGFMRCFDKSVALYKKRNGLQRRWAAIKLTLMLMAVNITAIAVLILQSKDLNPYIKTHFHGSLWAVKLISFFILILLVFTAVSLMYTFGPSLTHRFRFFSAGSVAATIMSIIATYIFFFLVNNFLNYNKVYGSIGTLIAFMVWVWLNTVIILLGYELNISILLGKLSQQYRDGEL